MSQKQVKFSIEHLDPKGQGVFKSIENNKIKKVYFISNTLIGEQGYATITKENKKIAFAAISGTEELEKISIERVRPECPYFFECGGCHYLHTNYKNELEFKKNALKWFFKNLEFPKIKMFHPKERYNYRNRIQLHYDKKTKIVGFKSNKFKIIPIDNCLNACPEIQQSLQKILPSLFKIDGLLSSQPTRGHIEFYFVNQKVKISLNKNYSDGGFSQINTDMNNQLKEYIKLFFKNLEFESILDLFGGTGNLSNIFERNSVVIDLGLDVISLNQLHIDKNLTYQQKFYNYDLFDDQQIKNLEDDCNFCDFLILDPPRSGFKKIHEIINIFHPKYILYVSCFPMTLARDLLSINQLYECVDLNIFDFFPGTQHFETCAILKQKI